MGGRNKAGWNDAVAGVPAREWLDASSRQALEGQHKSLAQELKLAAAARNSSEAAAAAPELKNSRQAVENVYIRAGKSEWDAYMLRAEDENAIRQNMQLPAIDPYEAARDRTDPPLGEPPAIAGRIEDFRPSGPASGRRAG